jgi:hypothetical protein
MDQTPAVGLPEGPRSNSRILEGGKEREARRASRDDKGWPVEGSSA